MIDILFVDDEPAMLNSLKRACRSMRKTWNCEFAEGPEKALEKFSAKNFDLIISDMRMPVMHGAALLQKIKEISPQTIRFILSGQSEGSALLRSLEATHQFLSKPCEFDQLKAKIESSFEFQPDLKDPRLKILLPQIKSLPSLKPFHEDLNKKLKIGNDNLDEIAKIISTDIGMSSKILQIANSSFFGVSHNISSPEKAVKNFGLDLIKKLVLECQIFQEIKGNIHENSLNKIWKHSFNLANLSYRLAKECKANQEIQDTSRSGGLLHEIGNIIIAIYFPEEYRQYQFLQNQYPKTEPNMNMWDYSIIGSYLAGIWGVPSSIIEIIAFHNTPSKVCTGKVTPLTFVHIANAILREKSLPSKDTSKRLLDLDYLEQIFDSNQIKRLISFSEEWIDQTAQS